MVRRTIVWIAFFCRLWRISAFILGIGLMGVGGCASSPWYQNNSQCGPGYYNHDQGDGDDDRDDRDDDDRSQTYGREDYFHYPPPGRPISSGYGF